MELRRELLITVGALVLLNVLLAFGVIGLFVRMGPVIDRILQENVYSIIAAEEMQAVFAEAGGVSARPELRERAAAALRRAQNNVTEPEERPILERIERLLPLALSGNDAERIAVAGEIRGLIEINRDAMRGVDRDAQRLGRAGAWAAVLVGSLSFLLSLVVVVRLRRRFLQPLSELQQVLADVREGQRYRRGRERDAPGELARIIRGVNALLDDLAHEATLERPLTTSITRAALVALLEREPVGALVVDRDGKVAHANVAALDALAGEHGDRLRESFARFAESGDEAERAGYRAFALPDGVGFVCLLDD